MAVLHPPPPIFGDADYRDSDTYALDCSANLAARGDTIASVGTPVVARADGGTIAVEDLVISNATVIAQGATVNAAGGPYVTGLGNWISWTAAGGKPRSGYNITFPLNLNSGSVLYRTVVIRTTGAVG